MKNKYAQESQDFGDNFGEDFGENFHDSLVAFLKQNKPIAPLPSPNFEQQLFAEIAKYPQRSPLQSPNHHLKRWLPWMLAIPVAIAAGMSFNWVNNRSTYQVATVDAPKVSESEQAEIEQSLISSWDMTNDNIYQSVSASTNPDTAILSEMAPLEYE